MLDRLKELWAKVQEWWNKYTTKQKSIFIGIVAVVILAFAIVVYVVSRPQYTELIQCTSTADASSIVTVLNDNNIKNKVSDNGLVISVDTNQLSQANLALGSSGYVPKGYTLSDYIGSSMTTTSSVQWLQYQEFVAKRLQSDISTLSAVKSCTVNLDIPEDKGTLISNQEDPSIWIQLEVEGTFTSTNAANLAKAVATFLKTSTANVTILNQDAEILFAGTDDYSLSSAANSMQELQSQAENLTAKKVKVVLLGTKQFDDVTVSGMLNVDYSTYEKTIKEYYANADRTEGMLASQDLYESENSGSSGGTPGTDSNDELTYMFQNGENNSSSSKESSTKYLPNENIFYSNTVAGCIDYNKSSITVAMVSFKKIHEEDIESQGLLNGTTWEDYKFANDYDTKLEVDEDYYSMVANASGISRDNITIVAYESPIFYDREAKPVNWTTVLSIVMLVIILGLLAFVVLRSMSGSKPKETSEELSVETMLQSTPAAELEDIDVETKSETRKIVEKFVDDNPEAAALLLRNWLEDDWG